VSRPDNLDISFEFFPPRTPQGKEKLRATWQQLAQLKPRFFSVTFGAGGSTREGTLETVREIRAAGHEGAPHISCVASSKSDIDAQLKLYRDDGIRHIVALRGDLPSGRVPSRRRAGRPHPRDHRGSVPDRGRVLSRVPSPDPQRRRRDPLLQAKGRCGRERRDHAVLLQSGCLFQVRR
jgi:hypothetical protein